jgi:glycine cleavage system H protein
MEFPDDRRYAETHEWAKPEGDLVRVGISDFAQDQLGDIVYVELPDPGKPVTQGEPLGVIESVKAVADLYAPVSGEVAEVNRGLPDSLDAISDDPYGRGWMLLIKASDNEELEALMHAADYEAHCKVESEK